MDHLGLRSVDRSLCLCGYFGLLLGAAWLTTLGGCRRGVSEAGKSDAAQALSAPNRSAAAPAAQDPPRPSDARPQPQRAGRRHVILMIGDGMQLAHEAAASRYLYGQERALAFHDFPVKTVKTTWDVNVYNHRAAALRLPHFAPEHFDPKVGYDPSIGGARPYPDLEDTAERRRYFLDTMTYPDSASTATAMSTGFKTYSSAIAWRNGGGTGDGTNGSGTNGALETSPELLRREYGMAIGFVTTVPFSHATPAAFFSHNPSREHYHAIAKEMLTQIQPEVMIGGGWQHGAYYAPPDLEQAERSGKYLLVHRQDAVDGNLAIGSAAKQAVQSGKRLIGLFGGGSGSEGNFPSPKPVDAPGQPKIARGSLESPTLGQASLAALEILAQDPDGFFLLIEQGDIDWANHTRDYARMVGCVSDLDAAVRAVAEFVDRPNDSIDWTNTTLMVTADHANSYLRLVKPLSKGDLPRQEQAQYPDGEVTYGKPSDPAYAVSHTAELVTVYAKGVAAHRLYDYQTPYPGLGIIDDTSIYRVTLDAARR